MTTSTTSQACFILEEGEKDKQVSILSFFGPDRAASKNESKGGVPIKQKETRAASVRHRISSENKEGYQPQYLSSIKKSTPVPSMRKTRQSAQNSVAVSTTSCKKVRTSKHQPLQQLYLDFGQKDFERRTHCSLCGMLYLKGVLEDEEQHKVICRDYKNGVRFGMKLPSLPMVEVRSRFCSSFFNVSQLIRILSSF